jgi:hypothetical protein
MVALRSRRLEQIFGSTLGDVTHAQLCELVVNGVTEAYDLDFKGELYGQGGQDKRALAGDVAAMANTAGGVIVLGIAEDDQARAGNAPGVAISDQEINRIHQIVASGVNPLPRFDVRSVEDPDEPGHGFIIIAVPRSVMSPHAVLINDALRYPRRNGTTTDYLAEAEVAEAYRARFAGLASRQDEAEHVQADFVQRLDDTSQAFVVVTLVPDLPGDFVVDMRAFREFEQGIIGREPLILRRQASFQRATVRRRRLVATGAWDNATLAKWLACELHQTGSGSFAAVVDVHRDDEGDGAPRHSQIGDESVVNGIASGLRFLARHARDRAAAGGLATLRVTLYPVRRDTPANLVHHRGWGSGEQIGRQLLDYSPFAEGVFDIDDLAEDGAPLLAATHALASGLFQEFGHPESLQLTPEGAIRILYWASTWQAPLRQWAEAAGIEVKTNTVQ